MARRDARRTGKSTVRTTLAALALLGPAAAWAEFHPSRPEERTPALVSAWAEPLDAGAAKLVNPFVLDAITVDPVLQKAPPIPESFDLNSSSILAVDVDAEGSPTRAYPVAISLCDQGKGAGPCVFSEMFARQALKWDFEAASKGGKNVASRASLDVKMALELDSIYFEKIVFATLGPSEIPPPVISPVLEVNAVANERSEGVSENLPPNLLSVESVDRQPVPTSKKLSIPERSISMAGDLLIHLTSTGTVDRVLPLEVRPPAIWPFLQKTVSAWKYEPARGEAGPVACWVRVGLTKGKGEVEGDLASISSVKRHIPIQTAEPAILKP